MVSNIESARPPGEVFSYVTDPSRFAEWQKGVVSGRMSNLSTEAHGRLTIELDFEGHTIGKLLVPLVVHRQAAKKCPRTLQHLRERLERTA